MVFARAGHGKTVRLLETVAEAYQCESVLVLNLFLELQKWSYAASVTLKSGIEGAREQDLGGITFRPKRSASFRELVKHGGPISKVRRSATDAVSRRSSVRVVGGFASGKWFVSLTGEVPLSSA
ncbi:MAG: hypothetical protein AAF483_05990 [Planctomycetota bacterium]